MLTRFLELIFPPREDERIVRACNEEEFLSLLDPQLEPLGEGSLAASLLPFTDERVRAAVHEAKYRGNDRAFNLLAAALADYLRELSSESAGFKVSHPMTDFVLVPVPLGSARRKERGYNQVEEVLTRVVKNLKSQDLKIDPGAIVSYGVQSEVGVPIIEPNLLARTRDTVSQVSLPRAARLRNMRDAFRVAPGIVLSSAYTYIVCDDVLTTGATLSAACGALTSAGAHNVLAVAFAH